MIICQNSSTAYGTGYLLDFRISNVVTLVHSGNDIKTNTDKIIWGGIHGAYYTWIQLYEKEIDNTVHPISPLLNTDLKRHLSIWIYHPVKLQTDSNLVPVFLPFC